MFCEINSATESGRITGQILVWTALFAGALKCWSISQRPTTNSKCALSLMIILLTMLIAGVSVVITKLLGASPSSNILVAIVWLAKLVLVVVAGLLAILGLIEFSSRREIYTQGRAQAIWALVLMGIFCTLSLAGFIRGFQRAHGYGTAGQIQPGKILVFDDLNFRYLSPGRPWVPYDASRVNKFSKLSFIRQNPEASFFIIAEKIGTQVQFTTEQLAAVGKANLQSAAISSRVIGERPWRMNGLNGLLVTTEAQVGSYQLYYRHWYCFTNGYAYQLVGLSKSEDLAKMSSDLDDMLARFSLVDPNRIASFNGGFTNNFYSPRHGYAVILTNSNWHLFSDLQKNAPMAEFGMSQGDSCMIVIPVSLDGEKVSHDALVAAFCATMDIVYPNEKITGERTIREGDLRGSQFDFARDVNGMTFHYRFRVLQGDMGGYMIAAWSQRQLQDADPVLTEALGRVRFNSPTNSSQIFTGSAPDDQRDSLTRGYILNQAGLYDTKQGDFEQGLPLFLAAAKFSDQKAIYVVNALQTWQRLDRPKEALAYLDTLPTNDVALPEVRASRAMFQAQDFQTDQAITNFASLFETGYRSDTFFSTYINLLAGKKQYDAALAAIQTYLQAGDSTSTKLLEAEIYRQQKDFPRAITLLKDLQDQAPLNTQVSGVLAETYILAGQYTESLAIAQELVKNNGNSAYYDYLKGRSEMGLKWYREAKLSFVEAVRLAPANKDMRSYLDYVSGLLGEGDNAAVLDPIEPVAMPSELTNPAAEPVPAGYAKDYGAYYLKRITAAAYTRNKEFKTTEFMSVRLLDPAGVSEFSTVQVAFDPLGEQIFINELQVIDANGKTISTGDPANYYVLDDRSTKSASQMKVLNIPVSGLQPGCLLTVTLTRRQLGQLNEFPFYSQSFSTDIPVRESKFYLSGDAPGLTCCTSPLLESQKLAGGLCWSVSNPAVARNEPLQPSAGSYLPMLWISDASAQWPAIASNYLANISDRLEPDPVLRGQSQALVAKLSDQGAKVALLSRYVQSNLTYKAIEFGRRARIPNKPADILQNKYGDCKDHAVLLQEMLAAVGVPARLALVNHRGMIRKDQPSLDQFDHMIVFIPSGTNGQFLDCTSKGADVAGAIPPGLAGQEALILDERDPRFVTIPPYPQNASSITVEQHIRVVDQQDLIAEESLVLAGVHAAYMRDYLLQLPQASRRTSLQHMMEMDGVDLIDLKIDSLDDPSKPLRLQFTYSLKHQFRGSEDQISGALRAGFAGIFMKAAPVDARITPFEINVPVSLDFKEFVDTPDGFKPVPPKNLNLSMDSRFATGQASAAVEGGKLVFGFKGRLNSGKFAANEYAGYRQTLSQVLSFFERQVAFKADSL